MSKTVVLIRHAKPYSEGYAEDGLRPLSKEGREVQYQMTKLLKEQGLKPTEVLTSPLLRARETAQFFTDFFDVVFEEVPALGDPFDKDTLLKRIIDADKGASLFMVGHAPTLADFLNDLAGKNAVPEGLAKSSAAVVTFDNEVAFGKGTFVAYYRP